MRGRAIILLTVLAWLINVEDAEAKLNILVDKATQRMLVIQDGYIRYMWPVSTGRDNMQTPNGVYSPERMERNWFSRAYYDSPMPFSIFFHRGYAIHGSYAIDRLGGPASHGCVRLHPHHAAILFDLVQQEGPERTTIEITDEGRPPPPPMAGREVAPPGEIPAAREMVPPRDIAPVREIAGPRDVAPAREMVPPRDIPLPRDMTPPPTRAAMPPSPPRIARYERNDIPDMPPPVIRASQPAITQPPIPQPPIAKSLPPPPRLGPPPRRVLADVKASANVPRNPGVTGEPDAAPKSLNEAMDSRPPTRPAEAPRVAEAAPPVAAQPAPQSAASGSSFKLLPTSCWSGGASRWQWWSSNQGRSCK
jgi:hypothetical protein